MTFYPEFNEDNLDWALSLIVQHMMDDEMYLEGDEHPYSAKFVTAMTALRDHVPQYIYDRIRDEFEDETKLKRAFREIDEKLERKPVEEMSIEEQLDMLYRDLIDQRDRLGDATSAEKMAYFRTATSLLERILGLKERAAGLRRIKQFQDIVIKLMDDVLTPDQRTKFMDELRAVATEEGE